MKTLYDNVSAQCSKLATRAYSTSFSLGIKMLHKSLHAPIYGIYGFVRLADEIVDSFHHYPQREMLQEFREQTYLALDRKISTNPILNSFQHVVNEYQIDRELIDTFLDSMEMDLSQQSYSRELYDKYILGSAEVVGLMCLRVFCKADDSLYRSLTYPAMKLGSAFQKINFLRDAGADTRDLGRVYFPGIDMSNFAEADKKAIEAEIAAELEEALVGINQLPVTARRGVYLAYKYYLKLFKKIRRLPVHDILNRRIRVRNSGKMLMLLRHSLERA